jgi:DNA helicase-2/ATP-dependent DNA helicase PcrA
VFEQREVEKLAEVKAFIIKLAEVMARGLAGRRGEVLAARKEMWREARIVLRDFDDVADLTVFAEEVARHERQYAKHSEELAKLSKMLDSPYFARIDFTEDGASEIEEIYIGRHSLFDDTAAYFHVYDWRAPISSLYYDHGTGSAAFTVPGTGAKISGTVSLKRQYQIEKGELLYLFDNDVAIEDEILRRELSKAASPNVKAIINTIQTAQNRAIRAEEADIIVTGPAGSGKTSVGLHRLAYLLYRHRDSLSSAKVRIFSPGQVFSSYLSGLIPELGEQDVPAMDFAGLIREKTHLRCHSYYEMLETADEQRKQWLGTKFSAQFLDGLEEFIAGYAPAIEAVTFMDDTVCDADKLRELYVARTSAGNITTRARRVFAFVDEAMATYYSQNKNAIADLFQAIAEADLSDDEVYEKFVEEKRIIYSDLKSRLRPSAGKLLRKYLKTRKMGAAATALNSEKIFFEDALLLLYVGILAGRVEAERNVRHILVDEAQDMGALQHRILRALYPESNFTVLADTRQALYPHVNLHETAELAALYPAAHHFELSKSYRSTYEIMHHAAGYIGEAEPNVFARHGEKPVLLEAGADIAQIIRELPPEIQTVGILLPTSREARETATRLGDIARLVEDESAFGAGVMVMAVPHSKGLEFDCVIAPTTADPKTMYLMCTRALHRLHIGNYT